MKLPFGTSTLPARVASGLKKLTVVPGAVKFQRIWFGHTPVCCAVPQFCPLRTVLRLLSTCLSGTPGPKTLMMYRSAGVPLNVKVALVVLMFLTHVTPGLKVFEPVMSVEADP